MVSLTQLVRFVEGVFGRCILSRDEKNIGVKCPICDPKDPNKKKLIIRTSDHVTHCWVCGFSSRTLVPLLKKYATRDQLSCYVETLSPVKESRQKVEIDNETKRLEIPTDITLLPSIQDPDPDQIAVMKYLRSRGLSFKDMWYYRLCYSGEERWSRRVLFVSHDSDGAPNYITGRCIDPKKFPKYVNCDVEKNSIVFNEINIDWKLPLVLCEGPFDLVNCGENATCILGSEVSESSLLFDRVVSNSTPVILALDSDTYSKKRPRIIKKFLEYDIEVKTVDIGGYPDPGSAPRDFMLEKIAEAKSVDWVGNFMTRLDLLD